MRILIVSFSVNGSMGDNFFMTTRQLSQENDVCVLTNKDIGLELLGTSNICNVRFDRKKLFDFINLTSYYEIYKYIKFHEFDICFICSPHPVNLFIYKIVDNRKIIPFVHDHILHSGVGILDAFFAKKQFKYYYNNSVKIIVSCDFVKKDILKHGLMKDESKIAVNYLGLLENLSFPEFDVKVDIDVLFFGRIEYYKGLDVLVEAGRQMANVKFVIAGRGDMKSVYGIGALPSNFEHINKYISDEELAVLIQRSKVVVLPYRDATGTQTIQSVFYYRKPVIATSVGCFPEYIEDGVDGIIVSKKDPFALRNAIDRLLEDEKLRLLMGCNGLIKLSTKFSNESISCRYMEIFDSINK